MDDLSQVLIPLVPEEGGLDSMKSSTKLVIAYDLEITPKKNDAIQGDL